MVRLIHDCRSNTELSSLSLDRPLTLGEQIKHRAHLLVCQRCRLFLAQQRMIDLAFKVMQSEEFESTSSPNPTIVKE